jgi:hypothetical protein
LLNDIQWSGKIENDRAIAVWGNYIEHLFELKKTGVLKARGFF